MLLAKSYLYRGRKISLRIDKISDKGYVYIDGVLVAIKITNHIGVLQSKAETEVDKEMYGNIYDIRA